MSPSCFRSHKICQKKRATVLRKSETVVLFVIATRHVRKGNANSFKFNQQTSLRFPHPLDLGFPHLPFVALFFFSQEHVNVLSLACAKKSVTIFLLPEDSPLALFSFTSFWGLVTSQRDLSRMHATN